VAFSPQANYTDYKNYNQSESTNVCYLGSYTLIFTNVVLTNKDLAHTCIRILGADIAHHSVRADGDKKCLVRSDTGVESDWSQECLHAFYVCVVLCS
jgi:hypothetical protein